MFNLEHSICEWRAQMRSVGVNNPQILDELENHLRDDCDHRIRSGESEQQAFAHALAALGRADLLKTEFAKTTGKKRALLRKLKAAIAAAIDPVPSLERFTPCAQSALVFARQEAPRLKHNFIGTEHVLLGLLALEEGIVPKVLKRLSLDHETVKQQIHISVSAFPCGLNSGESPFTPRVNKSLRLAAKEAKGNAIQPEHILLGLILEGEGVAARVLKNLGVSPESARDAINRTE